MKHDRLYYTQMFFDPIMQIARILANLQQAQASAERIIDLIETEPDIKDTDEVVEKYGTLLNPKRENWEELIGDIEFKNVSYKYPEVEKYIIKNVSMKIEAGEKVALVGVNGAGKTTLVSLMCGLLVPTEGDVLIDGHSIYEYNKAELYRFFSMVPQEYTLLPSSIAENVSLCEASERDVERINYCLKQAGLWDKIQSLEYGVESCLEGRYNPEGVRLSGGEIQKLLLARSLYRNAQILILDEPTAALDAIAEDEMYRKYNDTVLNTTSIFISHRLASTRFCDRIYVMDGASLIESGTHEELVKSGGKYQEMFEVQSKYYKEEI